MTRYAVERRMTVDSERRCDMQGLVELGRQLWEDESGQSTAEYALVILGAAAIAGALIAWAGGTDVIKNFFDKIFSQLMSGLG